MSQSNDPFWVYVDNTTDGGSKCVYCAHKFGARTSITRIKLHLSGVRGRGVTICRKVPENVQEEAYQATEGANKRQKAMPSSRNIEDRTKDIDQDQIELENAEAAPSVQVPSPAAAPHQSLFGTGTPVLEGQQDVRGERHFPSKLVGNEKADLLNDIESRLMQGLHQTDSDPTYWHNLLRSLAESNQRISTSLQAPNDAAAEAAPSVPAPNSGAADAAPSVQAPNIYAVEVTQSAQAQNIVVAETFPPATVQPLPIELMPKWEMRLSLIHGILDSAEQENVKEPIVKAWLSNLRDLAYDVEDIIEEFETEMLRSKFKSAESQASTSIVQKLSPTYVTDVQPGAAMFHGSKLQKIDAQWEDLMKLRNDLALDTRFKWRSNKGNKRVPSTSLVKGPKVYGREKAKEDLIELLIRSEQSNSPYSVIPIVGMGGIGKTTLAQLLYNDEGLNFDCKAWVCVSDDFDITRLTKTILLNLGSNKATDDLGELQKELKEKLHKKKFFIILDDIWHPNYEDWIMLCSPLDTGAPGSKIIITTRGEDISLRLGSIGAYKLRELPDDECLSLFAQHALDAGNFDRNLELKEVGQKIVQRCKGLPLAIKTLGGLLRHKKELEDWEEILNNEMWELSEEESGILSALRLSYCHLPSHLKRCFAYCAIFPKDYEFDENELVLLWMAEGFLQKSVQKKRLGNVGHKYFKDLLSRSFFQQSSGNKSLFVMHDLINDLAQSVSGERCFYLDAMKQDGAKTYVKVRHSSFTPRKYDIARRFGVFNEMEGLRTFLALPVSILYTRGNHLSNKVLDDLVPKLKLVRTLSLAGYESLAELPSSINILKLLRYLNLSWTSIERLPESLGGLLNLQTLILCGCSKLVELPTCIDNLINLQHLDIRDTQSLGEMPLEIRKLKNLFFLPKFTVGKGSGGLGIGDLRCFPHLQGQLHITRLDNIPNTQDAELTKLKENQGLSDLSLEWSDDFHGMRDEIQEKKVLNSLQPHWSLKKLSITSYGGIEFPSWVGDPSFSNLVHLHLCKCSKGTSLPSLGKIPTLRHLRVEGMNKLKEIVFEDFPSLETLHIKDMLEWELWSNGLDGAAIGKFPKLLELKLINCPIFIGKLPNRLPSLQKLTVYRCPKLKGLSEILPSLCELRIRYCKAVIFRDMLNLSSLKRLEIENISGLISLHKLALEGALAAVVDLVIKFCADLNYLWKDVVDLDKLANLKLLDISFCKQLVSLVEGKQGLLPRNLTSLRVESCENLVSFSEGKDLPDTLKSLKISSCYSLEALPDGMITMMNTDNNGNRCFLEELEIKYCLSLKSFPTRGKLPTTLKKLSFHGCENSGFQYSFVDGIMGRGGREMSNLEDLWAWNLSIPSFPAGKFPTSLRTLIIHGCQRIQSLPCLVNLSHLTIFFISDCRSLDSFPATGLPPKLTSLSVRDCPILSRSFSEWRLHTLTSCKRLNIDFNMFPYLKSPVDYFPDHAGLLLPTSLTSLSISGYENLKSISIGILNLTSLEHLSISNCPKLHVLPKEGFPSTLGELYIYNCPLLAEGCLKEGGDYWRIIPKITITDWGSMGITSCNKVQ